MKESIIDHLANGIIKKLLTTFGNVKADVLALRAMNCVRQNRDQLAIANSHRNYETRSGPAAVSFVASDAPEAAELVVMARRLRDRAHLTSSARSPDRTLARKKPGARFELRAVKGGNACGVGAIHRPSASPPTPSGSSNVVQFIARSSPTLDDAAFNPLRACSIAPLAPQVR